MVEETNKHFGLALTSLILGGVSLLSFMLYGLSAIPALIGAIFGLICLIKGQKHVRVMGGIGGSVYPWHHCRCGYGVSVCQHDQLAECEHGRFSESAKH